MEVGAVGSVGLFALAAATAALASPDAPQQLGDDPLDRSPLAVVERREVEVEAGEVSQVYKIMEIFSQIY